eukprot:1061470_1
MAVTIDLYDCDIHELEDHVSNPQLSMRTLELYVQETLKLIDQQKADDKAAEPVSSPRSRSSRSRRTKLIDPLENIDAISITSSTTSSRPVRRTRGRKQSESHTNTRRSSSRKTSRSNRIEEEDESDEEDMELDDFVMPTNNKRSNSVEYDWFSGIDIDDDGESSSDDPLLQFDPTNLDNDTFDTLFLGDKPQTTHTSSKSKKSSKKKKKKKHKLTQKNNDDANDSARIYNQIGLGEMEQGFVFDRDDSIAPVQNEQDDMAGGFFRDDDIQILNERKKNDKEEMSDDEEETELASRALVHHANDTTDKSEKNECSDDMSNDFHQLPTDVSQMTAKDIAELPASMQFEIMSKRRELLRHKTRPEFVKAAGNPSQYAQVQLKAFLKTSSLNQQIESLRKQTAEQFHQELLGQQDHNNNKDGQSTTHKTQRVGRIASEGDKVFVIKQTENSNTCDAHPPTFRFEWLDQETKSKRMKYIQKQRYKKKRKRGKYSQKSDYVARTLNVEMEDVYQGNAVKSEIVFEHWSCPICKYLNLKQRLKCDVCGIVRDEALKHWICSMCTHRNEGNNTHCMLCDTVNPDSLSEDVKPLKLEARELLIEDVSIENEGVHYDVGVDDEDVWICSVCHWKNSMLMTCCSGCNKARQRDEETVDDDSMPVRGLEVLLDENDDEEDHDSGSECNAFETGDYDVDEDEDDSDLILSAPALTIPLEESLETAVIQPTPERQGPVSPTKSTLSQMASSNVKSLLNIRDSLQNFYNIAKLTQQSTVLEEMNDDEQVEESSDISEHEDTNIEPTPNHQPDAVIDIDNMVFSEHESDDDIMQEMDIMPCDLVTPKDPEIEIISAKTQEEQPKAVTPAPDVPNTPTQDAEAVPSSFLFEIPTFDEVEKAEELEMEQLHTRRLSMMDQDEDEDEQKQIELPSETLNEEHKPLQRRKKRKRTDANVSQPDTDTPPSKKRKISNEKDNTPRAVSVDRNIGLNQGQIQNSLQRLYRMEDNIMEENIVLNEYQATARRDSEHVTGRMIQECRNLLDMFGIPYITSPSEAEAQCAELNKLGLVDGIITDDSDVFLFGGKTIYKNLFHMNKYVEKYTASLLESKLGLTQNKLISLAMLLGSDYTDGIKGIGPVNGMEIVQTFCSTTDTDFEGLSEFKKWIYATEAEKKPTQQPDLNIQTYEEYMVLKNVWFKYKHRNIKKHWFVEQAFPARDVIQTYLKPDVDESDVKFEWGKPDIKQLKQLCEEKFEWDAHTINATLDPIEQIVEHGRGAVQSSILSFADWVQPNKKIKSQRVQKAVQALIEEIERKKQMDAQRQ